MADPTNTASYVFLDAHEPQLEAGEYRLHAALDIDADPAKKPSGEVAIKFWVGAERYSIGPAQVHSVYPPPGSEGAYGSCLPHIALTRDTLPWERNADTQKTPWLALIVLHEEEAKRCPIQSQSLGDYRKEMWFDQPLEPGEADNDPLQVIHLDWGLAYRLIPVPQEIKALCHVRATIDANRAIQSSVAVVASKRAPGPGRNTVHLVSMENRYPDIPRIYDSFPLVSLMSWSFHCKRGDAGSEDALAKLFSGLDASWLRLPPAKSRESAEPYLARGRVPLSHRSRGGEAAVSWYAGPLIPPSGDAKQSLVGLPAASADELLWYHEQTGMLDVSYAAGWELGRLLALEHRTVAAALGELAPATGAQRTTARRAKGLWSSAPVATYARCSVAARTGCAAHLHRRTAPLRRYSIQISGCGRTPVADGIHPLLYRRSRLDRGAGRQRARDVATA